MTTLTLSGNSSVLSTNYYPPIDVSDGEYYLGLINYQSFNTIPNIDETQNVFHIDSYSIVIDTGSFEFDDLKTFILKKINEINTKYNKSIKLEIEANKSTLLCEIFSNAEIDFTVKNSIHNLLGFNKIKISPNKYTVSDNPINIFNINLIKIRCNVTIGSYDNNTPTHELYSFFPAIPSGYKLSECPSKIVYFPLNTTSISTLIIEIVDQNGKLINFRNENQSVTLHLKKKSK